MLTRIYLFFIGYATFTVPECALGEFTKCIFTLGVTSVFGKRKGGGRKVTLKRRDFFEYGELFSERGYIDGNIKFGGIPHIFELYGRRYGLILGSVILVFALFFFNDRVWRIEVSGNENVPDEKIISELCALGFYEGAEFGEIDLDILHNRFLAQSEDISWIAVNMRGCVAYVEVTEYMGTGVKNGGCANIVAECDGIITQVSVFDGKGEVAIGDEVKKGQLLISGVVEYDGAGVEYVYAKGEVYAEVERHISVKIPLTSEYRVHDGSLVCENGIKIFEREIFFSEKGRIDGAFYDTITMYNKLSVFGSAPLPIAMIRTEHIPYRYITKTVTEEEAARLAYKEYRRAFRDATLGVTLLSYETVSGMNSDGDAYEIDATLRVIADIAKTKEFTAH